VVLDALTLRSPLVELVRISDRVSRSSFLSGLAALRAVPSVQPHRARVMPDIVERYIVRI